MTWLSQLLTAFGKPFKWWVVVAPWEQGVRVRLGKTAVLLRPGPHWRIPFVDRIYVQSVRLRTISETNQTLTTLDGRVLVLNFAVRLVVDDMLLLYNAVANPEHTLGALVLAESARFVTTRRSTEVSPDALADWVNERLGEVRRWGLAGVEFTVTGFAFMRTYRLVMNDYRTGSGLGDLEGRENNGERV